MNSKNKIVSDETKQKISESKSEKKHSQSMSDEYKDVFNSPAGIKILMDEFAKLSGEEIEYKIDTMAHRGSTNVVYTADAIIHEVVKSFGTHRYLSRKTAEKFVEFMNSNKSVDMYSPHYSSEFKITKDFKYYSVDSLCDILRDTFNVDLEKLINKNRGKLQGEKFGL